MVAQGASRSAGYLNGILPAVIVLKNMATPGSVTITTRRPHCPRTTTASRRL